LTKAAEIAKEMGDQSQCIKLLLKAAEGWGGHGDTTRYGETLSKAAKELEATNGKRAESLHWKAVDILCPEDLPDEQIKSTVPPSALEVLRSALAFFLVGKPRLASALRLARRLGRVSTAFELESSAHKAKLTEVAVSLAMAVDPLQTQRLYLDMLGDRSFTSSKEAEIADLLVMAATQQDSDLLDQARQHPHLMFLDPPLAALIRRLSLLEMMGLAGDSADSSSNHNTTNDTNANNGKEDGGLRSQLFSSTNNTKTKTVPSVPAPAAAIVTMTDQEEDFAGEGEATEVAEDADKLQAELAALDTSFLGEDNDNEEAGGEEGVVLADQQGGKDNEQDAPQKEEEAQEECVGFDDDDIDLS